MSPRSLEGHQLSPLKSRPCSVAVNPLLLLYRPLGSVAVRQFHPWLKCRNEEFWKGTFCNFEDIAGSLKVKHLKCKFRSMENIDTDFCEGDLLRLFFCPP